MLSHQGYKRSSGPSVALDKSSAYRLSLYPAMSPDRRMSPTAARRMSTDTLPGFLRPTRPKQKPITELSVRELNDQHTTNARILSSP